MTVDALDNRGGRDSQTFVIEVIESDTTPPVITITTPEADLLTNNPFVTLTGTVDEEAALLLTDLILGGQTISQNADLSFTNTINPVEGRNDYTLSATDLAGNQSEVSFTVFLDTIAPNLVITNPANNSVVFDANLGIAGSIAESGSVTVNGLLIPVDINGAFSTGLTLVEGVNVISVQAQDEVGNTVVETLSVTYVVNIAPEVTSSANLDGVVGEEYQYDVEATDADNDILTYALDESPSGMTIDSESGEITWIPTVPGVFAVEVRVTDGKNGVALQGFEVTIPQPNRPPQITSSPPTVAEVDGQYVYDVIASDPDNDVIRFRLTDAPVGMNIDRNNGMIIWQPADAGTFQVTITVSDPDGELAQQSYAITVDFMPNNQPPELDPVADIIAPLGQTTRVVLSASDADGNSIDYSVYPLPLPAGATFSEITGEFEYRPESLDLVGTIPLAFTASDGRFMVEQTVNVTVPPPSGPSTLSGKTLLASGAPLVNVRLEMAGVETFSDINGDFTLQNIPESGALRLLIDGSTIDSALGTFPTVPEVFTIIPGADNQLLAPIYLMPLDLENADPINPATVSVISSADVIVDGQNYGPITITVPPGSATVDATGQLYDGEVSITRIEDMEFGPAPLPEDIGLSIYIAVQPFGIEYVDPAEVSFPNIEDFPPETIVEIFGLNHDTGVFEKTGEAEVTADGTRINSIGGAFFNNSWHGNVPPPPNIDDNDDTGCGNGCTKNGGAGGSQGASGSSYYYKSGNFSDDHSLVSYRSLGQSRNVRLEYNSNWANPNPVVNFSTIMGLPPPEAISSRISVGGRQRGVDTYYKPGSFVRTHRGAQFSAIDLETGIYPYTFTMNCEFRVSRRSANSSDNVPVINEIDSAIGAGWTISELKSLHFSQDGAQILLQQGSNSTWIIERNLDTGEFIYPAGFYTVMEALPGGYTLTKKNDTVYRFDLEGRLVSSTDRNNNETSYTYDSAGKLLTKRDPVGLITHFNYIGDYLTSIVDPAGRETLFEHDQYGNLTKITDPDNTFRTFEYDPLNHLMVAKEDKRQNRSLIEYDNAGKYKQATLPDESMRSAAPQDVQGLAVNGEAAGTQEDPADNPPSISETTATHMDARGHASTITFNSASWVTARTDELGRITEYERNEEGEITKITRPIGSEVVKTFDDLGNALTQTELFNGATMTYTYDPEYSLVLTATNPRNHTTTTTRDTRGNPITIVNHLGHTTNMDFNSQGLVTRSETPNGLVTEYFYNTEGLLETKIETPPPGSPGNIRTSTYTYYPTGLMHTATTPDGITLTYLYDNLNAVLSVTDNLGQQMTYSYDDHKNLIRTETKSSDGSLALFTESLYDVRNRLVTTTAPHTTDTSTGQPLNSVYQRVLDNNSNLTSMIDPNGNPSSTIFDAFDRVESSTHREGGITQYEYDDQDQITKVTAPNGVITEYEYDIIARKTKEVSSDRGTMTYQYDLANNVISMTEGRGITTTLAYDELERLISKTYPNTTPGKIEDVSYDYDCESEPEKLAIGRLCERIDESGEYDYQYDGWGNLISRTFTETQGIPYTISYSYDEGNHIIAMTYPSNRNLTYQRDGLRRLQGINSDINGIPQPIISNMIYRGDNQPLSCTYGNGLQDTRQYDLQGRLVNQLLTSTTNGIVDERTYKYDANSNVIDIQTNYEQNHYAYDKRDRLVNDFIDSLDESVFGYDLNDNRLVKTNNTTSSFEGDTLYTYQPNSNRLLEEDQIEIAPSQSNQAMNRRMVYNDVGRLFQVYDQANLTAEYIYNDAGQRTRKTVFTNDLPTDTTIYHYDQRGLLITETDENGLLKRDYIWSDANQPIAQVTSQNNTDNVIYLHNDHLLTNRLATDPSQTIVWRWEGEAFGNTKAEEDSDNDNQTTIVNLRFPGQYHDDETDWFYNWNRYYDPELGRYITSDPIGLGGGLNTYGYSGQNPVNWIDPRGLDFGCAFQSGCFEHIYDKWVKEQQQKSPPPSCKGTWSKVGWYRDPFSVFTLNCTCWWSCKSCPPGTDLFSSPNMGQYSTKGKIIFSGKPGVNSDIEAGDACLCGKPGPEEDCDDCPN